MERPPARDGPEGTDPTGDFRVEWIQDRAHRLVRITGLIDEDRVANLQQALIDLGGRRLTIDLSGASVADGLHLDLDELETRPGPRLTGILPPTPEGLHLPPQGQDACP